MANKIAPNPLPLVSLDSSVHNIPAAYSAAAGSAIVTQGDISHENFAFLNYTSTAIAISFDGGTTDHFVCPASNASGPASISLEKVRVGTAISIRSLSGVAISSGLVYLMVW